jgi:hypothetical protein
MAVTRRRGNPFSTRQRQDVQQSVNTGNKPGRVGNFGATAHSLFFQ